MSGVKVTYSGVKELDSFLNGLPEQLTDKILQNAAVEASKVLVSKEKSLAPEGPTGNLVDSIGAVRSSKSSLAKGSREIGQVTIGPRRRGGYKGFAAHLNEFGTVERFHKKKYFFSKPKSVGRMKAKPFIEPAYNQTKDTMIGSYNGILEKKVAQYAKRTLKK